MNVYCSIEQNERSQKNRSERVLSAVRMREIEQKRIGKKWAETVINASGLMGRLPHTQANSNVRRTRPDQTRSYHGFVSARSCMPCRGLAGLGCWKLVKIEHTMRFFYSFSELP